MKKDSHLKASKYTQEMVHFFEDFLIKEKELFIRNIHGFPYWHFIRFDYFDIMLSAKKWIQKPHRKERPSIPRTLTSGIKMLENSIRYQWRKDSKKTDIVILNSANRILYDGNYYDPYTMFLPDHLPCDYTIWEQPIRWRHTGYEKDPRLFYFDSLHLETLIKNVLLKKYSHSIKEEIRCLSDFAGQFGLTLSESQIRKLVSYVFYLYRSCHMAVRNRLVRKGVRAIILVNHYDPVKMLVTYMARSLGIYVIELQHGSMGRYHIAYNFGHSLSLNTLPDEIFTFGKFWNDTTRIRQNGVALTTIGMPYIEKKRSSLASVPGNEKVRILFLSQESIGRHLAQIAVDLSEKLDHEKYDISYKLHPKEYDTWKTAYPEKFKSCGITLYGRDDLYALLNETDIHIGVYSTSVLESLLFKKMLILMESYGVHYFQPLIQSGRAFFARNADDVNAIIGSRKSRDTGSYDTSHYWEKESLKKMKSRIEEILH